MLNIILACTAGPQADAAAVQSHYPINNYKDRSRVLIVTWFELLWSVFTNFSNIFISEHQRQIQGQKTFL